MKWSWLPNGICILRILLVAPIVIFLFDGQYLRALILIVIAGASDVLDGFLAKHFDWRSRLGSLLDPAADKLLVTSCFLTLSSIGLVAPGLTAIVIGRDVVIICGASVYQYLFGDLSGQPTMISKLNTACQLGFVVLTIVAAEFSLPPMSWLTLLGAAVVFTSITSGLNYIVVWSRRARSARVQ
jgi:cardiolipin synthase